MKFCLYVFVVVWLAPALSFAGRNEEAHEHYDKATAHFAVGEFADAAVEYQAAFKAKPDPALLYDAAQAYRLANSLEKALILYRNYLQLYPNEPNVAEVRAQTEKLREAIAATDKAKTAPPTGTNEPTRTKQEATYPSSPEAAMTQSSQAPASSTTAQVESVEVDHTHRAKPIYKAWWLWTVVGVVVAGGVVAAVVLSTTSTGTWSNGPDVGPGSRNGLTATMVRW